MVSHYATLGTAPCAVGSPTTSRRVDQPCAPHPAAPLASSASSKAPAQQVGELRLPAREPCGKKEKKNKLAATWAVVVEIWATSSKRNTGHSRPGSMFGTVRAPVPHERMTRLGALRWNSVRPGPISCPARNCSHSSGPPPPFPEKKENHSEGFYYCRRGLGHCFRLRCLELGSNWKGDPFELRTKSVQNETVE